MAGEQACEFWFAADESSSTRIIAHGFITLPCTYRYARRLLPKARAFLELSCKTKPLDMVHWAALLHLEKECGTTANVRDTLELVFACA